VVFIAAGAELVQRFSLVFLVFGAVLVYTAVRLLRSHGTPPDVNNLRMLRWARRRLPITSDNDAGDLVVRQSGRVVVTAWASGASFAVSDILFALDSIPAIFGITQHLYLVLCANAFALLGLRALYFLLIGLLDRLVHLQYGLAAVLAVIGVKLVLHWAHGLHPAIPEIPTRLSLLVIAVILGITTVTSLPATGRVSQRR
jgi:tellurite resistance protein TerC